MRPTPPPGVPFDARHAEVYDSQFERIQPLKDGLHLLARLHLSDIGARARILIPGAGTGAEARYLAVHQPGWRFTLVDPSGAMLAVARRHAEAESFLDRCAFVEGFLGDAPLEAHDGAVCLLVSHFLVDAAERRAFYAALAQRLRPGAPFVLADLAPDREERDLDAALTHWLSLLSFARGSTPESDARYRAAFGREFAAHDVGEVERLVEQAGFERPLRVYQMGLLRGWLTRRGPQPSYQAGLTSDW